MKKLFTIKNDGFFSVEKEGSVYSIYNRDLKKHTFFNSECEVLEGYSRPVLPLKETPYIDDSFFVEDIGEGFYLYTTHEIKYDPDGAYGLFGIKRLNGDKLTEEIYYQVEYFCNGLCAVCIKPDEWGCIDTNGNLVIPYEFYEPMYFNEYGVAVGNTTLIDRDGHEISDTVHNMAADCYEYDRYYTLSLLSDEQDALIYKCGTAPDITVDIYDTKNRKYVIKGVPECRLDLYTSDCEPEVVLAAAELIDQYEKVYIVEKGTICGKKDGFLTVYDFYQD